MRGTRYRHIFLFTGQGAQYPAMAASLYREEPVFRTWMDDLDRVCVEKGTGSVTRILYGGRGNNGGKGWDWPASPTGIHCLEVSHPALFMVQFALAKTLIHYGIVPDCLLGTSLGEYVGLSLAGAVPPGTMVSALIDHARLISAHCPPGGMVGILDHPRRYGRDPEIRENSHLAAVSSPRHFVVSGGVPGLKRVIRRLEESKTQFQKLPIWYGFHSSFIDPAAADWGTVLEKGSVPVRTDLVSCCTGRFVTLPDQTLFTRIGTWPIRLPHALYTLNRAIGQTFPRAGSRGSVNILDLGPGSYTSGFIRQNRILEGPVRFFRVMTLFGNEMKNLNKIKKELGWPR